MYIIFKLVQTSDKEKGIIYRGTKNNRLLIRNIASQKIWNNNFKKF